MKIGRYESVRRGFTLIELLVVIGIIMVLMGLTLPAVQSARESARRLKCQAQLGEIGKALNIHASTYGSFPYVAWGRSPDSPPWPAMGQQIRNISYSPMLALLPYLEQPAIHASFNFTAEPFPGEPSSHPRMENTTTASFVIGAFLCPSDPAGTEGPWGGTSYRYNLGPTYFHDFQEGSGPRPFDVYRKGAFVVNRAMLPRDYHDGLSNTAMFSERLRGEGGGRYNPRADFWYSPALPEDSQEMADACASLIGSPSQYCNLAGTSWLQPTQRCSAYGHDLPPNSRVPDCAVAFGDPSNADTAFITARSFHPGGVNVLYGDGHVQWVGDGIDAETWRAVGTRAGNEIAR